MASSFAESSTRRTRPSTPSPLEILPSVASPKRTPPPTSRHVSRGLLDSPPRYRNPTMSSLRLQAARLPRALTRSLVLIGLFAVVFLLVNLSEGQVEEGVWDASSYSDRRGSSPPGTGGLGAFKKRLNRWTAPVDTSSFSCPVSEPSCPTNTHPNYARFNRTIPRTTHKGVSRTPVVGAPDKYTTGPLPTIEEAWAYLHPKFREIKRKHQHIPREHELWNPIFVPALTEAHKHRFAHLRMGWDEDKEEWVPMEKRWLFVTICRQVAGMLGDWFAAWTVLADFLGPETMVFSLLEGDSADGSGEILGELMRDHLLFIGVPPENIHIRTKLPKLDWEANHRIELLANMRNAGMKPLYDTLPSGLAPGGHPWSGIIYYNDVYLSAAHFLELMHQHVMQDADMTCGWDHAGRWFYDGWVGRDMSGDLYTPFPVKEEDKELPQKLFINHWSTKQRFDKLLPFQVFAGWNGITVMSPTPFLPPYNVRFRRGAQAPRGSDLTAADIECQQSESSFISWDFWKYGFGRVQVVPGVHACYGKEDAMMRGWVEFPNPDEEAGYTEAITWQDEPPPRIRCHDWPDKPGKGYWAWDTVRWVSPPALEKPKE